MRGFSLEERLMAKFQIDPVTGCWNWTASRFRSGYGQIGADGKNLYVHRVSYQIHHGPIPDGMFVCHRCDNRICINPDHLFVGTRTDNMRDCASKGRITLPMLRGERHPISKLTDVDIQKIRSDPRKKMEVAKEFKISRGTVWKIQTYRAWSHIA